MRRVITVNLGGQAFQLDEDAYERLRAYIALTESRLGANPDRAEILSDLERSVAEHVLAMRAHSSDVVVSDSVIADVLRGIGTVEGQEGTAASASTSNATSAYAQSSQWDARTESEYTRLPVLVLCVFLGIFGLHRFFVGKTGTGVLQLITLGGLGLWMLYDLILIIFGSFTDSDGNKIVRWA